jgi:integrase/recombinase XerC
MPQSTRWLDDPRRELTTLIAEISSSTALSEDTRTRFVDIAQDFFDFCGERHRIRGVNVVTPDVARTFIESPTEDGRPSVSTMHLRRSAIRFVFRAARRLALCDHDPCLDIALPPRSTFRSRPLRDDEIAVCRSFALSSEANTRSPAAWALAEATRAHC